MSRLGRVDHVQRVFGAAVDLRLLNWGRCTTYTRWTRLRTQLNQAPVDYANWPRRHTFQSTVLNEHV